MGKATSVYLEKASGKLSSAKFSQDVSATAIPVSPVKRPKYAIVFASSSKRERIGSESDQGVRCGGLEVGMRRRKIPASAGKKLYFLSLAKPRSIPV